MLGAKLLGEIAERLGQPAVLGELLAGVLLGPSVLGLVPLTAGIFLVAEIGVILLLFEVGLETDLGELARVGAPALVVALAGMVLPFLGGFLLTLLLGHPTLTAIFVGAALTATSIGITARVLSELKVLSSREGQIILGAAVADDVLGLVVLAVVARIAETGTVETAMVLRATGLAVGFVVVALALGIPLGHRLIGIVGRANVRGILVAASVAFALLVARAAKKAGSAEIVGAFATGVVLARTDRRNDITIALKPVVDIFAPLFFVAVGAQVDVALLNPFARRESTRASPRARSDVDRFPRQVRSRLLRVGRSPAGLHRRRDGASRRGRPDLRLSREGHGSACRSVSSSRSCSRFSRRRFSRLLC